MGQDHLFLLADITDLLCYNTCKTFTCQNCMHRNEAKCSNFEQLLAHEDIIYVCSTMDISIYLIS